jgi:hypothetical protein
VNPIQVKTIMIDPIVDSAVFAADNHDADRSGNFRDHQLRRSRGGFDRWITPWV